MVAAAQERAAAAGRPKAAPPLPLLQCDRGVIDTALAAPQAGFGDHEQYPTLPAKAAVLIYTLAKSQACPDGNKRLALILTFAFLDVNYAQMDVSSDSLAEMILMAAESDRENRDTVLDELEAWLADVIVPISEEPS